MTAFIASPAPSAVRVAAGVRLGLDPEAAAVLALPPITRESRTFETAWAFKLVQKIVRPARFILPCLGDDYHRIIRFFDDTRHLDVLCTPDADVPLAVLLAASDLAVLLPILPVPVDALRAATAAHVPVLTTQRCVRSAGVAPPRGHLIAAPGSPSSVAAIMLRMLEQPVA